MFAEILHIGKTFYCCLLMSLEVLEVVVVIVVVEVLRKKNMNSEFKGALNNILD